MTFLLSSLYLLDFIKDGDIQDNQTYKNYYFAISILVCIAPLIVGAFRFYQTKILKVFFKAIKKNVVKKEQDKVGIVY